MRSEEPTSKPIKIYLKDGIYIRTKYVTDATMERVVNRYERHIYLKEKTCEQCEYFGDRPSDICEGCPNYKGLYKLHKTVDIKGHEYLRLPYGDRLGVKKIFGNNLKVIDKTPEIPMKKKFKLTVSLKPDQIPAVKKMVKTRSGVLKSPPRTGKCVVGSTMVYTKEGLVRIDSLFSGHKLSKKGATEISLDKDIFIETPIGLKKISHLYTKTVDETVRLTTTYGKSVRGTSNHPVLVAKEGCFLEWTPLSEVKLGDYVISNVSNSKWHGKKTDFLFPVSRLRSFVSEKATNIFWNALPNKLTQDLASLMGMLVADGRLGGGNVISFCNTSERKIAKFRELWERCFPEHTLNTSRDETRAPSVGVCSKQIKLFFEKCCGFKMVNAGEKKIPKILLNAPRKMMLHFLSGYMSCDGEIGSASAHFCSASFKYARQLSQVLTALGYKNKVSSEPKEIQLSHKTKGDRIGQYGGLRIKRMVFEQLIQELPFMLKDMADVEPRCIDQEDEIPFLRETLHKMSIDYKESHGVKGSYWKSHDGKLLPVKEHGTILRDKRGSGRSPHLNKATVKETNDVHVAVNWDLIQLISEKEHRRLSEYSSLSFEKIVKKETIEGPVRVYDVCVPGPHSFYGNGIVNHNTVMSASTIAQLGLKTLVLASQQDWLDNFLETFVGSDTQPAMTNIDPKRVGLARKLEDFKKYDVSLATYQTFLSPKGKKLLQKIKSMFSVLIVDEVQFSAAVEFSRVIGTLNCRHKHGVSGTPDRKDGLEWLTFKLIGGIYYENKIQRLRPKIEVVYPPFVGKLPQSWTYAVSKLEKHPERLKFIAQEAVKDIKAGHTILIPMQRVPVIKALSQAINMMMDKNVSAAFYGGTPKDQRKKGNRKELIDKMRKRKLRCFVGQTRLLSTGINIPVASMLYQVSPSSNLPKADQRFSRVLTPDENKMNPVFKYFCDDIDIVRSCMRAEHFGCVWPVFHPIIDAKTKQQLDNYFRNKKTRGPAEYANGYI